MGSLGLALYNERGAFVERSNLSEKLKRAQEKGSYYRELTIDDDIVSKARPGSIYKMEYVLGDSNENTVHAEGWICKYFPASKNPPTYRMSDQDGETGVYMGPVDANGRASGIGAMEYYDGKRFVGKFKQGEMLEGVLYCGSEYLCTMIGGKWDMESRDDSYLKLFPQEVDIIENFI